jgi:hypothetical protein
MRAGAVQQRSTNLRGELPQVHAEVPEDLQTVLDPRAAIGNFAEIISSE